MNDFCAVNVPFPKEFETMIFVHAIENVADPTSCFYPFYSTITAITEVPELEYVKKKFTELIDNLPKSALKRTSTSTASAGQAGMLSQPPEKKFKSSHDTCSTSPRI